MESDAYLVARVLAGEHARFADLVRRHERSVRAVAFAVLGDHHAASDVAQEAFFKAFRELSMLRTPDAFGGWVQSIARNQALRDIRRLAKERSLDGVEDHAVLSSEQPDAELVQRLADVIAQLPEHEQLVVMLYYFDGQSVRIISEITGRPIGTVTMQLSRARKRLRDWLKEYES